MKRRIEAENFSTSSCVCVIFHSSNFPLFSICCYTICTMMTKTKINEVTVHVYRIWTRLIRWWTTFNLMSWVKSHPYDEWLINPLWLSIKLMFVLLVSWERGLHVCSMNDESEENKKFWSITESASVDEEKRSRTRFLPENIRMYEKSWYRS